MINQSRSEAGLAPVVWDPAAAAVAQAHAEDMLSGPFFSHWNRAGYGPEHRAALDAGMTDAVFENIHMTWRTGNGQPAPILDWPQRILDAHLGLMDSPGHRRNILDPAHTHVGIGIAYRPELGELRLVQEFVNRYVELDPLPAELPVGAEVEISGRLLAGATDPLINLAYEPFPSPMTIEQLDATGSYQSAAQFFSAPRTTVDGGRFHTRAILDFNGQPGLYHIWVFVTVQNEQVLTASSIVMIDAD
ncbi:MAG: CAP domain-containing protein [Anaerolinea sp.]|nr:CAP domain-containing protein [Anaerolinea sp.]